MIRIYVSSKHRNIKGLLASINMYNNLKDLTLIFVGKLSEKELVSIFEKNIHIEYLENIDFSVDSIIEKDAHNIEDDDLISFVSDDAYFYDAFSISNIVSGYNEGPYDVMNSLIYDKDTQTYFTNEESVYLNFYLGSYIKNHGANSNLRICTTNDVIFYKF